jgi:hypothetical protein
VSGIPKAVGALLGADGLADSSSKLVSLGLREGLTEGSHVGARPC